MIQLNVVRSIRIILEALESPLSPSSSPYSSPKSRARSISRPPLPNQPPPPLPNSELYYSGSGSGSHSPVEVADSDPELNFGSPPRPLHRYNHQSSSQARHRQPSNFSNSYASSSRQPHRSHYRDHSNPETDNDSDSDFHYGSPRSVYASTTSVVATYPHLESLKHRLQPLKHIERMLIAKLVPPNEEEPTQLAAPGNANSTSPQQGALSYRSQEIFVRPGPGWKGALSRARVNYPGFSGSEGGNGSGGRPMSAGNAGLETQDEPQEVLNLLRMEMVQLWKDPVVKEILKRKKIKLEEGSGLYVLSVCRNRF